MSYWTERFSDLRAPVMGWAGVDHCDLPCSSIILTYNHMYEMLLNMDNFELNLIPTPYNPYSTTEPDHFRYGPVSLPDPSTAASASIPLIHGSSMIMTTSLKFLIISSILRVKCPFFTPHAVPERIQLPMTYWWWLIVNTIAFEGSSILLHARKLFVFYGGPICSQIAASIVWNILIWGKGIIEGILGSLPPLIFGKSSGRPHNSSYPYLSGPEWWSG